MGNKVFSAENIPEIARVSGKPGVVFYTTLQRLRYKSADLAMSIALFRSRRASRILLHTDTGRQEASMPRVLLQAHHAIRLVYSSLTPRLLPVPPTSIPQWQGKGTTQHPIFTAGRPRFSSLRTATLHSKNQGSKLAFCSLTGIYPAAP